MKEIYKRLLIAIGLGMILGIFCIIGQAQRLPDIPLPNRTIYLLHAWYNRVIMGITIGFAGHWNLITSKPLLNAGIRGAIIGVFISASFGLMGQSLEIMYYFAGIFWGVLIDLGTTLILRALSSKKVS